MANFWNLTDGKDATETGAKFEIGGGEPLPDNTNVLAIIDTAQWKEPHESDPDILSYINIQWSVLLPEQYKNRKIFQKIRVQSTDQKKADKAKRMLAAIDANAGGKLAASNEVPDNTTLTKALQAKQMMLKVKVWQTDNGNSGNWVAAVMPKVEQKSQESDFDDDMPF